MSINVKLSAAIALLFHAVILFVDNTAMVCCSVAEIITIAVL